MSAAVRRVVRAGALLAVLGCGSAAAAQTFSLLGGRIGLAGEASGTLAPEDHGYFNTSDYATSSLRLLRLDLAAEWRIARFASLLADVRSDNFSRPRFYALYLRLSPWGGRTVDLQAGLVPPVFGSFPRRRYASENPLPSVPLVYQYLTDLRHDAIPARAEQLVAHRGSGWRVAYPVGNPRPAPGLPFVNGERWDAGVLLRFGREPLSLAVALTQGSPSRPTVEDDNDGKQLAARLGWAPLAALQVGVSAARAEFLADEALGALPAPSQGRNRQSVLGADVQWSEGHWILRAEAVYSRWTIPALATTRIDEPLPAFGVYGEARFKIRPGLYAAARVERLVFERIASELGFFGWDAPVTRFEAGLGLTPHRQVVVKLAWQHNERAGGYVSGNDLVAVQLVSWF